MLYKQNFHQTMTWIHSIQIKIFKQMNYLKSVKNKTNHNNMKIPKKGKNVNKSLYQLFLFSILFIYVIFFLFKTMIVKADDQSKLEKPRKIKDETYNVNNVSVLQMV